jgi:hypothetical protein
MYAVRAVERRRANPDVRDRLDGWVHELRRTARVVM